MGRRGIAALAALVSVSFGGSATANEPTEFINTIDVQVSLESEGLELTESDLTDLSNVISDVVGAVQRSTPGRERISIHLANGPKGSMRAEGEDLFITLPIDPKSQKLLPVSKYRKQLLAGLEAKLLGPVERGPRELLTMVSLGVSLMPVVGECYDAICAAKKKDLITQEKFSTFQQGLVVAGLLTGVGSGILFAKLSKARVVVFTQHAFDPHGANRATEEGIRLMAKGFRGRLKYKFVRIGEATPEVVAQMIRAELKKGRAVVLNAHGMPDELFTGATEAMTLKSDRITSEVGEDLGGSIFDASCFSAERRAAWEKVVGPRGRVLTLRDPGSVNIVPSVVDVMRPLERGKLPSTYDYFYEGYLFLTYRFGAGVP